MTQTKIGENYHRIQEKIAQTAQRVGRDPDAVRLVTVTKGHPIEAVRQAITAGARRLGENYVEEAEPKIQAFAADTEIEWHMIGHVQSRKAEAVCDLFAFTHSLDRMKLARRLQRFAAAKPMPVLLECNVSGESSKYGWKAWQENHWELLLPAFAEILQFTNLHVRGLMTMAPYDPDPEQARPYFERLRQLQAYLQHHLPAGDWRELSMGMSDDFEVAIETGATLVRIGTAIMGPRPVP